MEGGGTTEMQLHKANVYLSKKIDKDFPIGQKTSPRCLITVLPKQ